MSVTITHYLDELQSDLARGNSTEHTHRSTLKNLIETLFPDTDATNEPKRIRVGAPDFVVQHGETPLGYIEAKDVAMDLDRVEKTDQLNRYLTSLGNLILTNYLEFRWYVEGELRRTVRLGSFHMNKIAVEPGGAEQLMLLLSAFMDVRAPTLRSPEALARKMASLAKQVRYSILQAFLAEDLTDDESDPLHDQYESFKEVLLKDLQPAQFADMYAQTITYGLFAARTSPNFEPPFTRYKAAFDIPKTNPFLQNMFNQMAGPDLPTTLDWIVDDLVNLLDHADIDRLLEDFGRRTRQEDPVVHFYETFLAAYDPSMREARGVYYTPEPVVSYIVRSVDHILKEDFGLPDGLADTSSVRIVDPERKSSKARKTKDVHKVQVLDPATGTGTFLHSVIDEIHGTVTQRYGPGSWSGYVKNHLLPRLFGFELLMAPYTVAHMKLSLQLRGLGYDFSSPDRLRIYLTNTLEEAHEFPSLPLFGQMIAREGQEAGKAKKDVPVMVVLGNPPYSGISSNRGQWITNLLRGREVGATKTIENYFEVDGKPLGERKTWLQDDYVKFIRFAQWRIERTGEGILAFITNHRYLDNITFRGMRESLLNTFDHLYFLDLHGSTQDGLKTPSGDRDENVFDIEQGVAIGIFVRTGSSKNPGKALRADAWGTRSAKYDFLTEHDVSTTQWTEVEAESPYYFFSERDNRFEKEYKSYSSITRIMPIYSTAVITARDHFAVDFERDDILKRIEDLRDSRLSDEAIRQRYFVGKGSKKYPPGDTRGWKLPEARRRVLGDTSWQGRVERYDYRPFDTRHIYFTPWIVDWPRPELTHHMVSGRNISIQTCRQALSPDWHHVFVSDKLSDDSFVSNKSRERGYSFPLYRYPSDEEDLFHSTTATPGGRRPNLAPEFIGEVCKKLDLEFEIDGQGDLATTFGPEDVLHYIYSILHAPSYRERYAESLRIDFPRIPLTSNPDLFRQLVAKGQEVISYHLMRTSGSLQTRFEGTGDSVVGRHRFVLDEDSRQGRIYINDEQYFSNVPISVWDFYIGGYQVADKWLKDRKARVLTFDDVRQYQGIVSALNETIRLMTEIDEVIDEYGGFPLP